MAEGEAKVRTLRSQARERYQGTEVQYGCTLLVTGDTTPGPVALIRVYLEFRLSDQGLSGCIHPRSQGLGTTKVPRAQGYAL
jgi:hypothetical protein